MKNKTIPQVLKEPRIGKLITKANRVCELADKGKSIYHSRWSRPVAAAFLQNMHFRIIVNFIRMGWLYEYHPKKK